MTSAPDVATTFTVLTPGGRRDVVLGSAVSVGDLLRAVGLPATTALVTPGGAVLREHDDLEELRGGEILTPAGGPVAPVTENGVTARPGTSTSFSAAPLLWCVAAALAALALVRAVDLATAGPDGVGPDLVVAVAAGAIALVLALVGRTGRTAPVSASGHQATATTAACWAGGAVAGLFGVPAGLVQIEGITPLLVPVTVALLAASATTALRYARAQGSPAAVGAGVLLAFTVVLAAASTIAVMTGWSPVAPAAVLLGIAPIAVRALPAGSLDVPDHVVVDLSTSQRTATSVRERPVDSPPFVRSTSVERSVATARARRSHAVVLLTLVVAALAPLVLLAPLPALVSWAANVQLWATGALGVAVAIALVLIPRQERLGAARLGPRLAAGFVLALTALWFARVLDAWVAIGVAVVLAALLAVGTSFALGSGWRSVRWSRAADSLESVMVAFAPAFGLLSAGVLTWLRLLASG